MPSRPLHILIDSGEPPEILGLFPRSYGQQICDSCTLFWRGPTSLEATVSSYGVDTRVGRLLEIFVPSPSWPSLLYPQQ